MNSNPPIVDVRETGTSLVFSAIRQMSPVPRIDIASATGFSPATVTSITADLINRGLIEEVAASPQLVNAKRGRPRVNLKIRGAAHLVAGMKLSDKLATVTIADFDGKRIADFSNPSDVTIRSAAQVTEFLSETLSLALENAKLKQQNLSGVGIGLPGVIDANTGHIFWSPTLLERDVPLKKMLHGKLGLPVFLDNDANLVAIAEQRFGLGKNARNFIVVSVEQGVGMGIVIDGKLYRGNHGCGAELGHTKVQLDGALCRCGQRGCLEAYIGDYALLREASTSLELPASATSEEQMEQLLAKVKSGDVVAKTIVRRAGRMFAVGLANVVNIFAPELIILSGERMQHNYLFNEEMINEMKKSIVQTGGPPPEVAVHEWGDQMWAMGAAAFAIDGITDGILRDTASYVA
ncbi:MAG: ROK family transcriptional regulator [Paracoccaceae bacterium]